MTWEYFSTCSSSVTLTLPILATRPTSLRPKSTSMMCSARSLGSCINSAVISRSSAACCPGQHAAEDLEITAELMQDPKERAEHIMLVDLGRNDVGRVAKIGSVKVTELLQVEK